MGGTVGHINHLYDNRDLTFVEMKSILSAAAQGKLERVTEKMDGQQLTFTFDVSTGTLLAARATGDIKRGGLDATALASKFEGRGSIADAFNTAFKVLDGAVGTLSDKTKARVFGPDANRWYSMEIVYTKNPNVINYDSSAIVFHGWPVFLRKKNGAVEMAEDDRGGVDLLTANIDRMQQAVSVRGWKVKGPAIVGLKRISDGTVLSGVLSAIDETISAVGVKPTNTMGNYLRAAVRQEAEAFGLNRDVTDMIVSRVLEDEGAPTLVDIRKKLDKSDHATVTQFVKNSSVLLKAAVRPIELAINDFAIKLLSGLNSTLIDDTGSEVERIKDEVRSAITAIGSSGDESAMSVLQSQLEKLQDVESITTPMEGVVFIWKGNAYKFTGSFAAANAILGLFKYGKGR